MSESLEYRFFGLSLFAKNIDHLCIKGAPLDV